MKLLLFLFACSQPASHDKIIAEDSTPQDTIKGIIAFPGTMTAGYWIVDAAVGTCNDCPWTVFLGSIHTYDSTKKVSWLPFFPGTIYDRNFRKVQQDKVRAFYIPKREQFKPGF